MSVPSASPASTVAAEPAMSDAASNGPSSAAGDQAAAVTSNGTGSDPAANVAPALSAFAVQANRGIVADYGPSAPLSPSALSASPDCDPSQRFLYFAYGSNLLPSILKLKQVHVHSARRGVLRDVQLLFDLAYDSLVEPSYANLKRHPSGSGRAVHGVVYELEQRDMAVMDRVEGNGLSYVREPFECELYESERPPATLTVWAYICHPNNVSGAVLCETPPSRRYLDVLIRGARHHQLDPEYVGWLEAQTASPLPKLCFTTEQKVAIESRCVTHAELAAHGWKKYMDTTPMESWADPLFICLKGVVFDVRLSRYGNAWKSHNAGTCLTAFTAGRVAVDADPSSLPTHVHDFRPEHQAYINATLVDWARSYPIIGHMEDRDKYKF